jgi:hypothetical protein
MTSYITDHFFIKDIKNMQKCILIYFTVLLAYGCECFPSSKGIVRDSTTKILLDSVLVKIYSDTKLEETYYTDSSGKYRAFISSSMKCKQLNIEFSKSGYDSIRISDPPTENNIVELKKR